MEQAACGGQLIYKRTTIFDGGRTVTEERYSQRDWRADAWHLERAYPEQWGRKDRVDLHMRMMEAAQIVAKEKGVTVEEVLAEAQVLLRELDKH